MFDTKTLPVTKSVMAGKTILWTSVPPKGLRFRGIDTLLVPFSVLWGGFMVVWETLTVQARAPWFFALWTVPFVLVGLYLIVGRFFVDAWLRGRTSYAVTDRAAYAVRVDRFPAVRRFSRSALDAMIFEPHANGAGTIRFIAVPSLFARGWSIWNGAKLDCFDNVADAEHAYALLNSTTRL